MQVDREANPEEMESEAELREVRKAPAAGKPVGRLRKRHRGRNLAAGRRGDPKKGTNPRNCEARKELAAGGRKMTRHAGVVRRKGNFFRKHSTRDSVELEPVIFVTCTPLHLTIIKWILER
jgi:hypothetical protein